MPPWWRVERLAAQQAKLEEEQQKNQAMREELERLKAQMTGEAADSRIGDEKTDEDSGGEP